MITSPPEDSAGGQPNRPWSQMLLSPEEAAKALRISRSKLYELLRSGTIKSVRIDRLRRIPIQALHEFVESLREG
jgi:excisionase family DNA binding protein